MNSPIGIFDSGLGGLSLIGPIHAALPNESLLYVADSAHCPYGDKTEAYVQARAAAIGDFLHASGCKAIVVACNTATAAAVSALRARFSLPVVGLEPAVKPAVALTQSGVVDVLATRTTLSSDHFRNLLARHGGTARIVVEAVPGLETVITGRALIVITGHSS